MYIAMAQAVNLARSLPGATLLGVEKGKKSSKMKK
jgi:hypothetical protein